MATVLTAQLEDLNDAHARSVAFLKELEESLHSERQESRRPEGTQAEERTSTCDHGETQSPFTAPAPKASAGSSIRKKLANFFSKGKRQEKVIQDVGTGEDDAIDVQCRTGSLTSLRTPSRVNVGAGLSDSVMLVQPASPATVASRRSSLSYNSASQALNRMPSTHGYTPSLPSAGGALVPTPRRAATERALGALEGNRSLSRSFVDRPHSRNSMEGTQALPSCPSPIYAASATNPAALPDIASPPQALRSAAARRASTGAVTWAAVGIPPHANPASGSPTGSPSIATPHPPARDAPRTPNENALRSRRLSVRQLQLPLDGFSPSASFTALPSNGTNPFNTTEPPHAISPHAPLGAAVPLTGAASPRGRIGRSTSLRPASHASVCHVAMPPGITVAAADDGETDDGSAYGDSSVYSGSEHCNSPHHLSRAVSGSSFRRSEQPQQLQPYPNRPQPLRSQSFVAPRASTPSMAAGGGGSPGPVLYGNGSPTVSCSMRRMLLQGDSVRRQLVRHVSMGPGGEGEAMEGQEGSPRVLSARVQEGSVRPLSARVQGWPCAGGGGTGGEGGAAFRGTMQYV